MEDTKTIELELKSNLQSLGIKHKEFKEISDKPIYVDSPEDSELEIPKIKSKQERREEYRQALTTVHETAQQRWLEKHGKSKFVQFNDEYRKKIRKAFESLDSKQIGFIGRNELEDSLIGLGLVETPQEVDEIMNIIDKDGSNTIEFSEFFSVLKSRDDPGKSLKILNFFTEFQSKNKTKKDEYSKELPFSLFVSQDLRKNILNAFLLHDSEGIKRLEAFKRLLDYREKQREEPM